MQKSKVLTYIGFAKKSGNLRSGVNAINTIRTANLLIVCATASQNTVKEAIKLSAKFSCPIMESKISVEEITGKENCKLIAITEGNLAKAILDNKDENFTLISGGMKE